MYFIYKLTVIVIFLLTEFSVIVQNPAWLKELLHWLQFFLRRRYYQFLPLSFSTGSKIPLILICYFFFSCFYDFLELNGRRYKVCHKERYEKHQFGMKSMKISQLFFCTFQAKQAIKEKDHKRCRTKGSINIFSHFFSHNKRLFDFYFIGE